MSTLLTVMFAVPVGLTKQAVSFSDFEQVSLI